MAFDPRKQVIVKSEVPEAPRDVAVDFTNRKVYWTALCCGLRRANVDGSNEEVVASAEFASGVALFNGSVFWADWMHGQIFRRDMNSSNSEEPIVTGLASPVDVAVDTQNHMIYWSDVGIARTQRASPDGGDIQLLNMSWAIMNTYGTWMVNPKSNCFDWIFSLHDDSTGDLLSGVSIDVFDISFNMTCLLIPICSLSFLVSHNSQPLYTLFLVRYGCRRRGKEVVHG